MNKLDESEIGVMFLAQLEEHELLKFISMNTKINLDLVKAFYCNLQVTSNGLECTFRNKLIKLTLDDFKNHFGLFSKGNEVCI